MACIRLKAFDLQATDSGLSFGIKTSLRLVTLPKTKNSEYASAFKDGFATVADRNAR
jgi:hypothetical protein